MNTLLTEEEVAKRLHVSLASIRRWRLERRGPQFIKVGSLVRYRPEDLESWLASLPTGGAQPVPAQAVSVGGQRSMETARFFFGLFIEVLAITAKKAFDAVRSPRSFPHR
jgi:excisionase family DNA binding protein